MRCEEERCKQGRFQKVSQRPGAKTEGAIYSPDSIPHSQKVSIYFSLPFSPSLQIRSINVNLEREKAERVEKERRVCAQVQKELVFL